MHDTSLERKFYADHFLQKSIGPEMCYFLVKLAGSMWDSQETDERR